MNNLIKLLRNDKTCPYQRMCDNWDDNCIDFCNNNYKMCVTYDFYKDFKHKGLKK